MPDYSQSSSGDGADPSEDESPVGVPAAGPHNQEVLSAAAEELFLNNEASSPPVESASGNSPIMNSRAYQTEMFGYSMMQNVIVAVSENPVTNFTGLLTPSRWILGVAKHKCKWTGNIRSQIYLPLTHGF